MSHYFESNPMSTSKERKIKVTISGKNFVFITDNDVFSKKGLDFGTRTLLESLNLNMIDGHILDFGCGYGPIGIYLAYHGKKVDMIDINNRALALSKKNSKLNKVDVSIFESNMYENITHKYDYIISNPPIRVGKKILYEILFGAKKILKTNGHLIFVVHKDQGAKTLVDALKAEYSVSILNKNKGFFVIDCQNR